MTAHTAITAQVDGTESHSDKLMRLMKRARQRADARDDGNWLGMGQIKQMFGSKDGDFVRGLLIKLVARGQVEAGECVNGIYWRAYAAPVVTKPHPDTIPDGRYILQREVFEGGRAFWFDAETFTNLNRAKSSLQYENAVQQARYRESSWERPQRLRLIQEPSA